MKVDESKQNLSGQCIVDLGLWFKYKSGNVACKLCLKNWQNFATMRSNM